MNLPEGAIRVRADEVQAGDVLWVDGAVWGEIGSSCDRLPAGTGYWVLVDTEGDWIVRRKHELVWVVRPEPTVTLAIDLPERIVRAVAEFTYPTAYMMRPFADACAEWVAANPQDGDPK